MQVGFDEGFAIRHTGQTVDLAELGALLDDVAPEESTLSGLFVTAYRYDPGGEVAIEAPADATAILEAGFRIRF